MKIAFLIQDISTQGGTERTTCCLAAEMARHGNQVCIVSVFASEGEQPAYELPQNVQCKFLSQAQYSLKLGIFGRIRLMLKETKRVRECAELQQADIIISQKLLATTMALLSGYRHKTIACEHYKYQMYNKAVRALRDNMYKHIRQLVVLTDNDAAEYRQRGVKQVAVIPNMISIKAEPYHGENSKIILSVGRLTEQKGYDLLLQSIKKAAPLLSGFVVHIYGDGPMRSELEQQIKVLELEDYVKLMGYSTRMSQIYSNACFYVMSSRFEGFPMVLLEAAAAGLSIVSFNCPEGPKQLLNNGGGILVEAENTDALADAISRMANNSNLRQQCREQLPKIIEEYTPDNIYNKWKTLINNL